VTDARLGADAVAVIVKNYAGLAGLDAGEFAAHSLRAGFLTSAAEGGANIFKMMETSRHKNMQTLKTYVRRADMFRDHAGGTFL
jgi:site-specific recombinase XerD